VLNVGVRDGARPPLLLDDASVASAQRLWSARHLHPERSSIERLMAVYSAKADEGEDSSTFASFACVAPSQFSDELVRRFAELVRASGWVGGSAGQASPGGVRMVLSSTWRAPQHRHHLAKLQRAISEHLGQAFEFDDKTQAKEDHTPEGRLASIGAYLAQHGKTRGNAAGASRGPLNVLVLDDFYNRALSGWRCGESEIRSVADAEEYLRSCLPASQPARVKVLHTYREWAAEGGLDVQVGAGLTREHMLDGTRFLLDAAAAAGLNKVVEAPAPEPAAPKATGAPDDIKPPKAPPSPCKAAYSEESNLWALEEYQATPWPAVVAV